MIEGGVGEYGGGGQYCVGGIFGVGGGGDGSSGGGGHGGGGDGGGGLCVHAGAHFMPWSPPVEDSSSVLADKTLTWDTKRARKMRILTVFTRFWTRKVEDWIAMDEFWRWRDENGVFWEVGLALLEEVWRVKTKKSDSVCHVLGAWDYGIKGGFDLILNWI